MQYELGSLCGHCISLPDRSTSKLNDVLIVKIQVAYEFEVLTIEISALPSLQILTVRQHGVGDVFRSW